MTESEPLIISSAYMNGRNACQQSTNGPVAQAEQPGEAAIRVRGASIKESYQHGAGAFARCSYCGRYSDNPKSLSRESFPCDCGKLYGWSGSFVKPTVESLWSEAIVMPVNVKGGT